MKLALIGASQIAAKILPAIRSCEGIEIVGFGSHDDRHAKTYSAQNQIPFLGSYDDVFRNQTVEAVYISNSNIHHGPTILEALKYGKHVLCEKPLALSEREAISLFDAASRAKRILLEGLMYRFHPQIVELKKRVASGDYGKPIKIRANLAFDYGGVEAISRRLSTGGGALPDLGCYLVDFIGSIAGHSSVRAVRVFRENLGFSAFLAFENGLLAEIGASMAYPSSNPWEVICERGALSVLRFNPHGEAESELTVINNESERTVHSISSVHSGLAQFSQEFLNFRDCIQGHAEPFVSADESVKNAALLERLIAEPNSFDSIP